MKLNHIKASCLTIFEIGVACLFFAVCASSPAQERVFASDAVGFCEVETKIAEFVDRELVVNADFVIGWEGFWLSPAVTCDFDLRNPKRLRFTFAEEFRKATKAKILGRMDRLRKKRLKTPTDQRKLTGTFVIKVLKYHKQNDFDTRFDFVVVLKSVLQISKP
ncbi:MAG: hypothetical protein IPN69_13055 [Acidobacteria bacterium]|nr:hypothetical protein [Acidobacteriota bacterium]